MNETDTIRRVKNKTAGFTIILNEVFRRVDLSARAKGLYAYIMTLPDTWEIHREELFTHFTEGRNALDAAFKELRDTGYIHRLELRDERGTFAGFKYVVYETAQDQPFPGKPQTENGETVAAQPFPQKPFPQKPFPQKPFPQKPFPQNQQLLITDLSNYPEELITHTQNSCVGKKDGVKNETGEQRPITAADPPMQHHRYPVMDWQELYDELKAAGFPDPGGAYRLNVLGRDLLTYFDGLTREQIIAAVRNYGLVKQKPGSWWNSNPNILYWAQKHITNFLPENFRLEHYFRNDSREADPETERRRRLEAQVLGGSHESG
jgi:hypothetical protein